MRVHNFKDLTGQRFGRLTVIKEGERSKGGRVQWLCKCDCGSYKTVTTNNLTSGRTKSCGCLHREAIIKDLTGKRFGRLTVIRENGRHGRRVKWLCRCDCGNFITALSTSLVEGNIKSCGCLQNEIRKMKLAEKKIDRSLAQVDSKTRLHKIWAGIKARTENVNDPSYELYGARGISMCNEWKNSFKSFKMWALDNGYNDTLTIDRIDNDKGYFPENCRWSDARTQANNKRNNHLLSYNGKTQTISQWAEEIGIGYDTLHSRIQYRGWSVEKALTTPVRKKHQKS